MALSINVHLYKNMRMYLCLPITYSLSMACGKRRPPAILLEFVFRPNPLLSCGGQTGREFVGEWGREGKRSTSAQLPEVIALDQYCKPKCRRPNCRKLVRPISFVDKFVTGWRLEEAWLRFGGREVRHREDLLARLRVVHRRDEIDA